MKSNLAGIWDRRHLLGILVVSNLKRQNKNTALGYLWWLLDPILMTAVYYVLVAVLFRRGEGNQPYLLFVLCGLLSWKAFSDSLSQAITSIRAQASIVKAISFPKAVIPLSLVLSNTVYFLFAMLVAVGLALWYAPEHGTWPTLYYFMLPVVVLIQVLFTAGIVLVLATLGIFFLDTTNIVGHVVRMWFFLSPGLYSIDFVPETYRFLFSLNPFCGLMTAYRDILMYGRMPAAFDLAYTAIAALLCGLVGFFIFRRFEGKLAQRL
ncbi:MAG: ABC transporter permease [Deltaproteobacteria bacterium]|nr:ABC transporter permease [Deltaproteobacteria bacterium]